MAMLTVIETYAKCFTFLPPSLSLFSRYTVIGYYGKEPDQRSLLLFAHCLHQIKVMSLIPTDVYLCWVTLSLQREVLSLRQTSVYSPLEKPVTRTMKSHWGSNHQSLEHREKRCILIMTSVMIPTGLHKNISKCAISSMQWHSNTLSAD